MTIPYITALYAGLTGVLLAMISLRVSLIRLRPTAARSDTYDADLAKAIRVQGNLAEYAAMAILLLLIGELVMMPTWLLHLFGLMFVGGRLAFTIGFARTPQIIQLRKAGIALNYMMLTFAGLANIYYGLF